MSARLPGDTWRTLGGQLWLGAPYVLGGGSLCPGDTWRTLGGHLADKCFTFGPTSYTMSMRIISPNRTPFLFVVVVAIIAIAIVVAVAVIVDVVEVVVWIRSTVILLLSVRSIVVVVCSLIFISCCTKVNPKMFIVFFLKPGKHLVGPPKANQEPDPKIRDAQNVFSLYHHL